MNRTADGQQVSEGEAFDERGQLRDGFTMRTKLTLIDGVPVVAPAAGLTDEQRYTSSTDTTSGSATRGATRLPSWTSSQVRECGTAH
jgi:hypothetical protein